MSLPVSNFDYELPAERIAQHPPAERGCSRLMALDRSSGNVSHHVFANLPGLLRGGDVLVVNDTHVVPARFFAHRATGGRIEGLFLREVCVGRWEVLLKGASRCRRGEGLELGDVCLRLGESLGRGRWLVEVSPARPAVGILEQVGRTPLPPYIRREAAADDTTDRRRYQTVYANRPGAVAAPTAGLHFTDELLAELGRAGVEIVRLTLHVGLGTFAPVTVENVWDHQMHAEWFELSAEAADHLNAARAAGHRIIAVGTTAVRVLETVAAEKDTRCLFSAAGGWTDIFIYPPAEFRAVDAMVTNFHLPRSTLLMLVAAFCEPGGTGGTRMICDAYAEAIKQEYRFYSYGDAMLIV